MPNRINTEEDILDHLCKYPELIDDELWGIRQGMKHVYKEGPFLKRKDHMPNGRQADMVFVEPFRITVVELKKDKLYNTNNSNRESVVDQILVYLHQCTIKYPNRNEYRGYIVGSRISDQASLELEISYAKYHIVPLTFQIDIPLEIVICSSCGRALAWNSCKPCKCGYRLESW